jgi:hypothetical protein
MERHFLLRVVDMSSQTVAKGCKTCFSFSAKSAHFGAVIGGRTGDAVAAGTAASASVSAAPL